MSRTQTPLVTAALWFHDRVCAGANAAEPRCTGDGRKRHAGLHRERARAVIKATTALEVAAIIHAATCTIEAQAAHGGYYAELRDKCCGTHGEKHIAYIAADEHGQYVPLFAAAGVTAQLVA